MTDAAGRSSPVLWVVKGAEAPVTLRVLAVPALPGGVTDAVVAGAGRHGVAVNAALAEGGSAAFFYDTNGSSVEDFNGLLSFDNGWSIQQIAHIDNLGRVVGMGTRNGKPALCALTPLSSQGLSLRITPDRDRVQPGERLGLTLQITGPVPPLPRNLNLACSLPGARFEQVEAKSDGPSFSLPLPLGVKRMNLDVVMPTWQQAPDTPIRIAAELITADLNQAAELSPVFAIIELQPLPP
jgi:hypothetical protein